MNSACHTGVRSLAADCNIGADEHENQILPSAPCRHGSSPARSWSDRSPGSRLVELTARFVRTNQHGLDCPDPSWRWQTLVKSRHHDAQPPTSQDCDWRFDPTGTPLHNRQRFAKVVTSRFSRRATAASGGACPRHQQATGDCSSVSPVC